MTRFRIIIFIVAILVFGVPTFIIYHNREPRYEGRTLTDWIVNHPAGDQYWHETACAVQNIGTNAFPFLLEWVSAKDSRPKARIISWLRAHPWLHVHIRSASDRQEFAYIGFRLLGDAAKPAWPALVQRTYDQDSSCRRTALRCLVESHADRETLLPVFQRLLKDPDRRLQSIVALEWIFLYPDEEFDIDGRPMH